MSTAATPATTIPLSQEDMLKVICAFGWAYGQDHIAAVKTMAGLVYGDAKPALAMVAAYQQEADRVERELAALPPLAVQAKP